MTPPRVLPKRFVPYISFWVLSLFYHRELKILVLFMQVFLLLVNIMVPCFINRETFSIFINAYIYTCIKREKSACPLWNETITWSWLKSSYIVVLCKTILCDNFWDMLLKTWKLARKNYKQKFSQIISRM